MGVQSEKVLKDKTYRSLQPKLNPDFVIKDSGQREQFASGMVRDTQAGKIDYWRGFIGPMFKRLCVHVTKACTKYPDVRPGVPNWTLASGDAELARFKASAVRHFMQWFDSDEDEDHAAAIFFNVNGYEFVKDKMIAEAATENTPPPAGWTSELHRQLQEVCKTEPATVCSPDMVEVPLHELPTTPQTHELVRAGNRTILLPTPDEALRRIQAMEQEDNR